MRNSGHLLIESLVALGARKSFGVPDESYLAALDGFHDSAGTFDFVLCRNEGGAAFMAAAYGKLERTPGICFVTRGPGATNASIGVHTAMQDSVPMLLFVGQVGTDMKGREAFQELDYKAVFGSMAKWVVEIDEVSRIPELLMRAWARATTGRPGPVVIALPEDMLSTPTDLPALAAPLSFSEPAPDASDMTRLHELLSAAERPLIIMGGGGWKSEGSRALESFAESSGIPVTAAFRFQDQYDNYLDSYVGEFGVGVSPYLKQAASEADLILAINIRFGEMTTSGYEMMQVPLPKQTLVHVHISDLELGKIYQPDLAIHAGPNAFSKAIKPMRGNWTEWRNRLRTSYLDSFSAPAQPSPANGQ